MAQSTEVSDVPARARTVGGKQAAGSVTRRGFLHLLTRASAALTVTSGGSLAYTLAEAKMCQVERVSLPVPNLPAPFVGMTIAFLVDTHHGPFVPLSYLEHVVSMTNALGADLIALGGDYVQRRRGPHFPPARPYVRPGIEVLAALKAPLGTFAVLGNHDNRVDARGTRQLLAEHGMCDLTNTGLWLEKGGARLRLCGLDDHTTADEDIPSALGDTRTNDACHHARA